MTVDIEDMVSGLTDSKEPVDARAALAALWARLYVRVGRGWERFPSWQGTVDQALVAALRKLVEGSVGGEKGLVEALGEFDVENDGSAEWEYLIELVITLHDVLSGTDEASALTKALSSYLSGSFNIVANDLASEDGVPISFVEADVRVPNHPEWRRALDDVGFGGR